MKNYYTSAKTISKNQFFKDRVILNPGELKEKLSSVHENEKEAFYIQKFNALFDDDNSEVLNRISSKFTFGHY